MLLKIKLIYLFLLVFCAVMVLMVYFAYVDHLLLTWEKICFKTRYVATLIFICCTPSVCSSFATDSHIGHPSRDIVCRVISKNNLPCAALDFFGQSICDACVCVKAHNYHISFHLVVLSLPWSLFF
jgi:hypothetical protein